MRVKRGTNSDLASLLQDGKHATELVTHTLFLNPTILLHRGEDTELDKSKKHVFMLHVKYALNNRKKCFYYTYTDCIELCKKSKATTCNNLTQAT